MNDTLKARLLADFGLTEENIQKLEAIGVKEETDLALLSAAEIQEHGGVNLIAAKKIAAALTAAQSLTGIPLVAPASADTVIPDGSKPSVAQVNSYAATLGIDPTMISMLLFSGMGGGMDMDLSGMLPVAQIAGSYSPKRKDMPYMIMGQIERRLGTPIVIINQDGSVNTALTVKYIQALEDGFEAAENGVYYDDSSAPYEVVRVGVDAQSIYDADPLVPTKALQQNGMGTGRINWKNVALEIRQVAYYAATQTGELNPNVQADLDWLRDHMKADSSKLVFQGRAPKAVTTYNEAARAGSLPTLRVLLGRSPRQAEFMPRRRRTEPRQLAGLGITRDEL